MIRLDNIKIYQDLDGGEVIRRALRKARIRPKDVTAARIVKKSIDARDKGDVHYVYALDVAVADEAKYPKLKRVAVREAERFDCRRAKDAPPVVIVGAGPAGLFCALTLAEYGYRPVLIEQGARVEERQSIVDEYRTRAKINTRCNVQFGEGGAGTFSDGKLTTGIKSPYIKGVLEAFCRFGAPEEITYLAHPHIGTDNLVTILKNMRAHIESLGGRYFFDTKFVGFEETGDAAAPIRVRCEGKDGEGLCFDTDAVVLAIGHSARDTFGMLLEKGAAMRRKSFSVGVRMEHLQRTIDEAQYGTETTLRLPPAEYKLVYHGKERSCYSFCMCPGGEVIASASEPGRIVTNGMSRFARDGENANAALLVNVNSEDFPGAPEEDPLAGMRFQDDLEQAAFRLGGGNGFAPVQRSEDFLAGRPSERIGRVKPTYLPGYTLTDLGGILPGFVAETLREAIPYFDRKIKGYGDPDAILTGVETRSSSPVTILRGEDLMSSIPGLYPCGEGPGYAGGITSAAVDGIKVARQIIETEKGDQR